MIHLNCGNINMMAYAKNKGASFKNTVMIGRQQFSGGSKAEVEHLLRKIYPSHKKDNSIDEMFAVQAPVWCEGLFKYFGAETVDSIDCNSHEGATIIHDMNMPVGNELKEKFTVVWDGGSLEHIFNYPAALKNCMEMTAIGGYFISFAVANNHLGHGFYQFSPEVFFSVLDGQNGFSETEVFLTESEVFLNDDAKIWYRAWNPKEIHKLAELHRTKSLTYLFAISKKTGTTPFNITPIQSFYVDKFNNTCEDKNGGQPALVKRHSFYLFLSLITIIITIIIFNIINTIIITKPYKGKVPVLN